MEIKNKVAVITGVSKGIGASLCRRLLAEGCRVYGLGRNNLDTEDARYTFIPTDVRHLQDVESAFARILEENNGTIDILINNAGLGYFGNIEDLPAGQWQEMMQTNVDGMFFCCKQTVGPMKKNGGGHIINIASTAALEGMPMVSGYCASKWAVRGFSESLWRELRDFRIKVSCVYPGSVKTDFFRNSPGIKPHDYMLMPDDVADMLVYALKTPDNFHQVNLELRPLQPKGPVKA